MSKLVEYFSFSDKKLFYVLNKKIKCKVLDVVMPRITNLGGAIFSLLLPVVLILLGKDDTRILGFECLTALSVSHIIASILKKITNRERPYNILKNISTFNIELKDYSFPSGHTTASFSLATVLSLNIPYLMTSVIAVATLIAMSRVYVGVHYPSDVIVGIILGSVTSIVIHPYFLSFVI